MHEKWKDIEGYPGYQVSNLGQVRSLNYRRTGQVMVLKPVKNEKGYLNVQLPKNEKIKTCRVHRLVATAFIPNPDNLPYINHKDENKENNFVWINPDGTVDPERSNLEWCDCAYNNNYGTRNQRQAESQTNRPDCSKRVAQYSLDGILVAIYPSAHEAARQTGFLQGNISNCCRGLHKTAYGFIWRYI